MRQRSDEYACDGTGSFYCLREYVKTTRYASDGDTHEDGVQYCHSETHTIEKLTRIQ